MKHLDNIDDIVKIRDIPYRNQLLNIRRFSVMFGVGLLCPFTALYITHFKQPFLKNIFNVGSSLDTNISSSLLPFMFRKKNIKIKESNNKHNLKFVKFIILLITSLIFYINYKFNVLENISNFYNLHKDTVNVILITISYYCSIIGLIIYSFSLFILNIKNNIEVDLSWIKFKFIRDYLESIIKLKDLDLDFYQKELKFLLNMSLLVICLMPFTVVLVTYLT
jgi:hypothetical protein